MLPGLGNTAGKVGTCTALGSKLTGWEDNSQGVGRSVARFWKMLARLGRHVVRMGTC